MSRQWRPERDLDRLISALAEEILAATAWEMHVVSAVSGCSAAGAAREVRDLIRCARDDDAAQAVPGEDAPAWSETRQH